jgi:hypothetical protein
MLELCCVWQPIHYTNQEKGRVPHWTESHARFLNKKPQARINPQRLQF